MGRLKVLLADSKEIFREGLAKLLEEREHIKVVSRCSNGEQVIEEAKETEPDVVLISSDISDCGSGEATRRIKKSSPLIRVAMLTDFNRFPFNLIISFFRPSSCYTFGNLVLRCIYEPVKREKCLSISPWFSWPVPGWS